MSTLSFAHRYWNSLIGAGLPTARPAAGRGKAGYTFWQRYLASFIGVNLPVKLAGAQAAAAAPAVPDSGTRRPPGGSHGPLVSLPRFHRPGLRLAASPAYSGHAEEGTAGELGLRWVLRDAGQGLLEIVVESPGLAAGVLPVTVVTPAGAGVRERDYLMVFQPDSAGGWAAALRVPDVRGWADVTLETMRPTSGLGAGDVAVVERSVAAAPDLWARAWHAVAEARVPGDPVREAVERALSS